MTAPSDLFGDGLALDDGIEALCGGAAPCPRYHHCGLWLDGWIHPDSDVPAWTAGADGAAVCAERDLPVPKRRRDGHAYPADARMDRNGLPLGRYGEDGRLQVGGRENYHGKN